jgi:putative membrane protein
MLSHIFIAIFLGCFFGIFTGLIPGIHVNLISIFVLSTSAHLLNLTSPIIISIFIISMAITHTFLDTIPSIFLGAPEEGTALSVLPGHKMLLKGKGYEGVMLTLIGSFFSLILAILISPLIAIIIKLIYPTLQSIMGFVLILASCFLIIREKKSRIWALIIFLLAGILGLGVTNLPTLKNPLFPMLSGLFGTSTLIISLSEKSKIPKQKITFPKIKKKEITKVMCSSLLAGGLCSFLPGLGPSQAAIIGSSFYKKITQQGFMILIGGLNTINMVLSFLALYLFNKARNGAIVAVSKIMESITLRETILFFGVALVVGGIAVFLTIKITKIFAILFSKINYKKLLLSIIFLITIMVFILSSQFLGLLILIVSTFTGILPAKLGIGRNHLMGCLLLPVILYFL